MMLYFHLPKTYNHCLIRRKTSDKLKLKDILQVLLKTVRVIKIRKVSETVTAKRSLKKHDN